MRAASAADLAAPAFPWSSASADRRRWRSARTAWSPSLRARLERAVDDVAGLEREAGVAERRRLLDSGPVRAGAISGAVEEGGGELGVGYRLEVLPGAAVGQGPSAQHGSHGRLGDARGRAHFESGVEIRHRTGGITRGERDLTQFGPSGPDDGFDRSGQGFGRTGERVSRTGGRVSAAGERVSAAGERVSAAGEGEDP